MSKKRDKGGILGLGILSGKRSKILEKVQSKPAPIDDVERAKQREFCELLDEAIRDEDAAPPMYEKLARKLYEFKESAAALGPFAWKDHQTILAIRNQEIAHKKLLEDIRKRNCIR